MTNILSQEEIDALLGVVEAEAPEAGAVTPPSAPAPGGQGCVPYDFRRPNRVSKEQLRFFGSIHQAFGRQFGSALSSHLRSIVDIEMVSADQLTYGEYMLSLPASTALFLFEMQPLEGSGVLEMNPSLVLMMVDRLFGGSGGGAGIHRELTTIETAVVTKMVRHGLQALGESWERVAPIRPALAECMKNPQTLQLLPNTETVIRATFELRMGEQNGSFSLCYPFFCVEPVFPNMSSREVMLGQRRCQVERGRDWIEQRLADSTLAVSAILGRTNLTVAEFLRLRPGDVIRLDRRADEAIELLVGGEPKGMAYPGLRGRNRAVRLDTALRRGDFPDVF